MKNNQSLQAILNKDYIPFQIKKALEELRNENAQYAADEVLAVGEEILSFLAGLAIMAYLRNNKQEPNLNQYLLELFLGLTGGNAGSVFRNACYMANGLGINDKGSVIKEKVLSNGEGNHIFNDQLNQLSELRNQIMHGIFVLPPEVNNENTDKICEKLDDLFSDGFAETKLSGEKILWKGINIKPLFTLDAENNIVLKNNWAIFNEHFDEDDITKTYDFEKLYKLSQKELSGGFIDDYKQEIEQLLEGNKSIEPNQELAEEILTFLKSNKGNILVKGSYKSGKTKAWAFISNYLNSHGYQTISYRIANTGLSYSVKILKQLIAAAINEKTGIDIPTKKSKIDKYIAENAEKSEGKLIIIIDDIHKRHFASGHVLSLVNQLYQYNIRLIGFAPSYPTILPFFNSYTELNPSSSELFDTTKLKQFTDDFIFDKGPSEQYQNADYERLLKVVKELYNLIKKNNEALNLRRFAGNGNDFSLQLVEEAAWILSPVCMHGTVAFEKDERSDGFNTSVKETESSYIYHILGRRDLEMEAEIPTVQLIKSE